MRAYYDVSPSIAAVDGRSTLTLQCIGDAQEPSAPLRHLIGSARPLGRRWHVSAYRMSFGRGAMSL